MNKLNCTDPDMNSEQTVKKRRRNIEREHFPIGNWLPSVELTANCCLLTFDSVIICVKAQGSFLLLKWFRVSYQLLVGFSFVASFRARARIFYFINIYFVSFFTMFKIPQLYNLSAQIKCHFVSITRLSCWN